MITRSSASAFRAAATLVAAVLMTAAAGAQAVEGIAPVTPQPAARDLAPGLSVLYYFNYFRHVREIPEWAGYRKGRKGPPIPALDYRVGKGDVLTSGQDDAVGAHITGMIRLARPGTYTFAVQSNDGVRLEIGGKLIIEDPEVHADRYSDAVDVTVAAPGWYPLEVLYFERKNTSTLELYWLTPGDEAGTMNLVPASALAHREEQ